jgi:hypothetical protein
MTTVVCTMTRIRRRRPRTIELYSERPIRSERDLLDFIEALDEDEGIRVEGKLRNPPGGVFIFVGYYRGSYCVNICDRVWNSRLRKHVAGGKDEWYYFDKGKGAFDFVMKEAKRPIRAWMY